MKKQKNLPEQLSWNPFFLGLVGKELLEECQDREMKCLMQRQGKIRLPNTHYRFR